MESSSGWVFNLFLESALQIRGRELDGPTLAALILTSILDITSARIRRHKI